MTITITTPTTGSKSFIVVTFSTDAEGEQFESFSLVTNTTEGAIISAFGGAVGTTHVGVDGSEFTLDHIEEVTTSKGVNLLSTMSTWMFVDMEDGTVAHRTNDHMDGIVVDRRHFMFGCMK